MGYYNNVFLKQLKIGQIWEQAAIERIIKYYHDIYYLLKTCNSHKYDFKLSNKQKYEVKADLLGKKTNNIFIEYLQFGKFSGIDITQANFYIIIIPDYYIDNNTDIDKINLYLLLDVNILKELIINSRYKKNILPRNNNNMTGGYLFDVELIKQYSQEF
jgi:hypothetical protein